MPCARSAHSATVGQHVDVLVDVDRKRRLALQLRPAGVARLERLLHVLDAEVGELAHGVERLVELPVLVDVDLERDVGDAADGPHALDVEPVAASELQLQAAEVAADGLRAPGHVVGIAEPDRPRGRRAAALEAEQAPHRLADELPAEVVQRAVEPGLRRVLAGDLGQAVPDRLEGEGIVAEEGSRLVQERLGALDGLAVVVLRLGLAEARDAVVLDLDPEHVLLDAGRAGDRERLRELEGGAAVADPHPGYTKPRPRL